MFGLSAMQLTLIFGSFVTIVIVSEVSHFKQKQHDIDKILTIYQNRGMCSVCLEREWKRLKKMSAIDVQITLYKEKREKY